MADFKMRIVSKPPKGTGSVLSKTMGDKGAYFADEGEDNYVCGQCGHVLIAKWGKSTIANVFLMCPTCGKYNTI